MCTVCFWLQSGLFPGMLLLMNSSARVEESVITITLTLIVIGTALLPYQLQGCLDCLG